MQSVDLLHVCPGYQGLGGIEAVLQHHYANDGQFGLRSRFLVFFESGPRTDPRIRFLNYTNQTTIRAARSAIQEFVPPAPDIAVYHVMHGMTFLADLDQAQRRIVVLHGYYPGIERSVISRCRWFDGILCVSEPLQATIRDCLPRFDPTRIDYIPYPIDPPAEPAIHAPWGRRPLVIGYSGRLLKQQKRVDRFPELFRHLDQLGVDYRMELLGDGPDRGWLETQFRDNPRFVFHGRQSGPDYWRIISGWDAILFTSDFEGTPISMIEAMNRGVIPVYPKINTGGDAYASGTARPLLYEAGDVPGATRALAWLASLRSEEFTALRQASQTQVARHDPANYHRVFDAFARRILKERRVSQRRFPIRPFVFDGFSFEGIAKLADLGRKVFKRGSFRAE